MQTLPNDQHHPATRPRFFYVKEAAQELRRTEASVRWLIHTKAIKTGTIGGRVVISAAEIDRLIDGAFAGDAA